MQYPPCDRPYSRVSFEQAKAIMDSGDSYAFVDVRTELEYTVEHGAGAISLPLDEINAESAQRSIPDKNAAILLYCRTGRRSKLAADKLASLGYVRIYDIGSLSGWPYGRDYGC
ncbi:rhodanese-like domain-containing protein [Candidatus Pseudoscillospira sp. SGI.172]|uniref:rhodanese-like domain-containing protein n=1 Tax=Candidatus Pseudoscillospira sp. SGI.172 TaxID=3420582 RepID=UPI0009B9BA38|nr:rhodanese-like domain-containing protein [Pseudoflavonifractor sp.]